MRPHTFLAFPLLLLAFQADGQTVYKWIDDDGVTHYTDSPPEGREYEQRAGASGRQVTPEPEAAATPTPTPAEAQASSNCEIARKNVETFGKYTNIAVDTNGDGKPEELDESQRAAQLAHNQEMVKLYCTDTQQ